MEQIKPKYVALKCPGCATAFKFPMPAQAGLVKVKCPKCGQIIPVKLNFKPVTMAPTAGQSTQPAPAGAPSQPQAAPAQPEAAKPKKGTKVLPTYAMTSTGVIEIVRFGGLLGKMGNTSFPLHEGQNTIGRADVDLPSDIEIKNDTTVSRRSVAIEVTNKEGKGYQFKLKVLRALNPVMHNDKPLIEGEIVYLNYGDSIRLGKTTLRFKRQ